LVVRKSSLRTCRYNCSISALLREARPRRTQPLDFRSTRTHVNPRTHKRYKLKAAMTTFAQDLRYGWRMMQRSPGFSLIAILALAIGIGANAAMFSVINAVLMHKLPFANPDRVVLIWDTDPNRGIDRATASPAEFLDWRDQAHVFQELSAFRTLFFTVT